MTGPQALTAAHYRPDSYVAEPHCSRCVHYVQTTKAGEGRCAANEGAAVTWLGHCDKYEPRQ